MDSHTLVQALIYLGSAALIVPIAVRLGLGSVLGYLIAGCIIGPWGLRLVTDAESILHFAEIGVVLMLFFVPGNAFGWLMPAGSIGAAVTLMIILIAAGRGGFSPHRMLLAGMALSTAFTMLLMMLQASGDPRMAKILTWISGSTYNATGSQVVWSGIAMLVLLAMVPLCRRWMTILPLGGETARAVGMALTPARVALLLLAACLTVQGSRPGVFGGEALILPLMALLLYVGYEAGRLSTLAQAEQRRRRRRAGPPYRVERGDE